jgi:hypothetical protein
MLEPGADPVRKVSIVPRGRALGVTFQSPSTDRYGYDARYLEGRIVGALGGRAAEELIYGNVTTGAESDLEQVTSIARQMVGRWGMSDVIGLVSVLPAPGEESYTSQASVSDGTRELVDSEVRRIVEGCYERAQTMLGANRERLESLTRALLEQETLDQDDAYRAAGWEPGAAPGDTAPAGVLPDAADATEAAAGLYTGAMLERLGPFAIVDRILELWLARGLPVGATGAGSRALDRYWLGRDDRLTDAERRETYDAVFDARFDELWTELVVALAEGRADAEPPADMVRAHLGGRIDERTIALTPLLIAQLRTALDVLADREILETHGARDMWQLIEQRARLDLGAEVDVVRAQTMAAAGTEIIGWLALHEADVVDEVADAARSWLAVAARQPGTG